MGFVTMTSVMRAAVIHKSGATPNLQDFPDPAASENELLITVLAASLKPIDKQLAAGTHYASPREFPVICGTDGVGRLPDGSRVFFAGPRRPYGSFAQRTVVRLQQCFPIPDNFDDATAAAVPNPGVSAWLSLSHRAGLRPGETVLILGATESQGGSLSKSPRSLAHRASLPPGAIRKCSRRSPSSELTPRFR
jgi:NADPH2:quinone reductase